MADATIDIVAMGDAIVDVIASCDEAFLTTHALPKGSMQLLTPDQADTLYAAMGQAREMSGGSAANSMAGIAAMGGKSAFIVSRIGFPLSMVSISAIASRFCSSRSAIRLRMLAR